MPSFDDWVTYSFTRGYAAFHGKADADATMERISPTVVTEYLTRLFDSPSSVADRFSHDQIADGIWFILGTGSEWFHKVRDNSVPRPAQRTCYRGLKKLYRTLFDPLCRSYDDPKVNLKTINESRLEGAVYMIWDMDCVEVAAMLPEFDYLLDSCLEVLAAAARDCRCGACKVNALHGLGHLAQYHPQRVEQLTGPIVRNRNLPRWLREYAEAARAGYVQ